MALPLRDPRSASSASCYCRDRAPTTLKRMFCSFAAIGVRLHLLSQHCCFYASSWFRCAGKIHIVLHKAQDPLINTPQPRPF